MNELAGRTALVTGASGGVVPHIVDALAGEGMNLALSALSEEELRPTVARAESIGVRTVASAGDVTRMEDLNRLVETAEREFGGVDVLINGAGIEFTYVYHKLDLEDISRAMTINLVAPMLLSRLLLPEMVRRGRGHIVCISSVAAKFASPYSEPYAASKAGLIAFTKSLRSTYRDLGISATSIIAGFIEAGMYTRVKEQGIKVNPLVGSSPPEKVASAVLRGIKRDKAEIYVNPRAPMLQATAALGEFVPSIHEISAKATGSTEMARKWALLHERERAERAVR
ncbi:MAG TPA: SDR family oxidoreductase [Chloroflexota bacterium]